MSHRHLAKLLLLCSVLVVVALLSGPPARPTIAQTNAFEPADCGFYVPVGLPVECGYLTVPADRTDPTGDTMRLHISRYASFSETPAPEPVVVVLGGPGGGPGSNETFALYQSVQVDYAIFLERRDLIVLDQRGTGYSEPSLNCRAYEQTVIANAQAELEPSDYVDSLTGALMTCFDDFAANGIDLTDFSTSNTVEDLEDLRTALGYETWNLYGVGYGTQPALAYAAAYPDATRSLILSSPIVDAATWLTTRPQRVAASLETLFESCTTNPECVADFPTLATAFNDAIVRLADNPIDLPTSHPITGAPLTMVIDEQRFIETVKWSMLFSENILFMPFIIDTTALGSYQFLAILSSQLTSVGQYWSEGAFYAIMCQEAMPYIDGTPADTTLGSAFDAHLNIDFAVTTAICTALDLPPQPPFSVPTTAVPILALGGGFDHVSSTNDIEAIAAANTATQFMTFPALTYDVLFSRDTCPLLVTGDFLRDPTAPLATECLSFLEPPNFISVLDMLQLQGSYTPE